MQKINLRELYPDGYKTDVFVDVAEEVVAAIRGQEQDDAAYERRMYRHKAHKKTTVITTNLAFNRWDEIIADKVLVTAMVDRLTHKAILLNMTGKSYRMKETQDMINKQI